MAVTATATHPQPARTKTPLTTNQKKGFIAAYAGWTTGSAAHLLAVRELAHSEGVEDALLAEWRLSLPEAEEQSA